MSQVQQDEDIAAIRALIADWRKAVEAKDVAGIIAGYTPDSVLFDAIPPAKTVGAKAIGQLWANCFPYMPERYATEHRDLVISVSGDLAFAHGLFSFLPEDPTHPCASTAMRVSVCYRRVDGRWTVHHEHVSVPFDPMANVPVFLSRAGAEIASIPCAAKTAPLAHEVHSVTPHLVCDGAAAAIDFYKAAFGAEERMRIPGPDGRLIHACVAVNGSTVMLVDAFPEMGGTSPRALNGTPVTMHLPVPDVDAALARAEGAGAAVIMPAADMFWGDRYALIEDPFGHRWSLATTIRPMNEAQLRAAAAAAMSDPGCGPQ